MKVAKGAHRKHGVSVPYMRGKETTALASVADEPIQDRDGKSPSWKTSWITEIHSFF